MFTTVIVLVLVVLIALWAVLIYNGLVGMRNRVRGAWSDIEVQLKRRHDLVGNLVETVKGYASHEAQTLEAVVEARNKAIGATQAGDAAAAAAAEGALTTQLRQLFALAESYPDLKASANFMELQQSLGQLEDAIQNARRYYNAVVRDYNTQVERFPAVFVARSLAFETFGFFELEDEAEAQVPHVSFGQS
jgi:LemA protein